MFSASKDLHIKIAPISAYIEDTYITQLLNYATSMAPPRFLLPDDMKKTRTLVSTIGVYIPDYIMVYARILSTPLRLQNLKIDPVSILLSVHTSVRLYVALDHSPLYFGTFEKKNILTTPYRLGNALTMHYLSGAIFGAGMKVILFKFLNIILLFNLHYTILKYSCLRLGSRIIRNIRFSWQLSTSSWFGT